MIDKRERVYQAFGSFLADFMRDLNNSSEDGWSILVEGLRDEKALRKLGYEGAIFTVPRLRSGRATGQLGEKLIVLTDLDREGTVIASKYVKMLSHEGIRTSLSERRRLRVASRGVFLHVENLSRFAVPESGRWESPVVGSMLTGGGAYREGLRRFRRRREAM